MRFIIIGAGAIGGTIGGRLAAAGNDVVLVARGAHGEAIAARGLRVDAPDGEVVVRVPVAARVAAVAWRAGDVALVAVKTQDCAAVMIELAACAPATTPVACLTNGLEAERIAARWFADVHAVCVITPAEHLEPGLVRQWAAPVRGILDLGRYPAGNDAIDRELATAFVAAGYASEPRADILRWKRTKLLNNLGNALEALCGPSARVSGLFERARGEAVAVFAAAQLDRVPDREDEARRVILRMQSINGETRRGGSTWQSLARGRSLETDYLNGEIALLGRLHGVATPVNAGLQRLAAAAAREGRKPGSRTIDEVAAAL